MFTKETVFVLGAGASWHYGYPTGEVLVLDVLNCARRYADYCRNRVQAGVNIDDAPGFVKDGWKQGNIGDIISRWGAQEARARELVSTLEEIDPLVIDYFLGWNDRLHDIGRLMIAAALLERETGPRGSNYNRTHAARYGQSLLAGKDHWLRFVVHQLLVGIQRPEQLADNTVTFITFNYDLSLERSLRRALTAVGMLDGKQIDEFFSDGRIVHVYGTLAANTVVTQDEYAALSGSFQGAGVVHKIAAANALIEKWYLAAQNINVIDPHEKTKGDVVADAQKLISKSEQIYFLGFGFDDENLKRLGFPLGASAPKPRRIAYTNMLDSLSVNKRAAKAFEIPALLRSAVAVRGNVVVERSTRNVYDAIEWDLGALSE